MQITDVRSAVFEWEHPGIWNGGHFYGLGRLHKVTVETDEGIVGYGWNGGREALECLSALRGIFSRVAHWTQPDGHTRDR